MRHFIESLSSQMIQCTNYTHPTHYSVHAAGDPILSNIIPIKLVTIKGTLFVKSYFSGLAHSVVSDFVGLRNNSHATVPRNNQAC